MRNFNPKNLIFLTLAFLFALTISFSLLSRHSPTLGALPTPQSVFDGAPATNIKAESDEGDRAALLPELSHAVSSVNDILEQVVCYVPEQRLHTSRPSNDLPWRTDADDFPSAWSENELHKLR